MDIQAGRVIEVFSVKTTTGLATYLAKINKGNKYIILKSDFKQWTNLLCLFERPRKTINNCPLNHLGFSYFCQPLQNDPPSGAQTLGEALQQAELLERVGAFPHHDVFQALPC